MTAPALELRNVTKHYDGSPPIVAVDEVTLTMMPGELVAIVGASGSGKSTLLNLMGLLDRPTSGSVCIAGLDTRGLRDRRAAAVRGTHIGFVFQQFHLIPSLDAAGNVANGLLYRGVARRERRNRAAAALHAVGLAPRATHRPTQLSGGERQRVAIARALVGDPALVLADEPTGNLDSNASRAVVDILLALNREGRTIAIITHDHAIASLCHRVMTMRDGHLSEEIL